MCALMQPARAQTRFVLGLSCMVPLVSGCDVSRVESSAGRYVVVHWKPSVRSLCGGTVSHIDNSVEVVANTYGVPLPEQPSIDIFWKTMEVENWCGLAAACASVKPNGTSILFVDIVADAHELTHAIRLTGSRDRLPSFFMEGAAVRWEVGPSDFSVGKESYIGNLDYPLVRSLLGQRKIAADYYDEAGFLWAWLEANFGPEDLAKFASRTPYSSDSDEIEVTFEEVFGISLAEATDASRGQPLLMSDVHACALRDIPKLEWENEPLLVSGEPAACGDFDIVNTGAGGGRIVHLSLPDVLVEYSLEISGSGESSVRLDRCLERFRPYESAIYPSVIIDGPSSIYLSGEYALTVSAPIESDGTVELPTVRLSPP